jgi:hypothetical protein
MVEDSRMNPNGYDREITSRGEYESWLDWQDSHISVEPGRVVVRFEHEYSIELQKIGTQTRILIEAFNLLSHLELNEPSSNPRYIAKSFINLVRKRLKLPYNTAEMFEELASALIVRPRPPEADVFPKAGDAAV